jgi:hypothetical protein
LTDRKAGLGGKAQIALKDYPRLTYGSSDRSQKCVDLRNIGSNAVLKDVLAAASDLDDLGPSRKVGAYLLDKGIEVVGGGANIAAFLDGDPPAKVAIGNRKEILEARKNLAKRKPPLRWVQGCRVGVGANPIVGCFVTLTSFGAGLLPTCQERVA